MDVLGWAWRYGLPALLLLGGLAALRSTIRTDARRLPRPRDFLPWLPVLLISTGDAAVGDGRPAWERVVKGLLAALLWTGLGIVAWRRRRLRRSGREVPMKSGQAVPVRHYGDRRR